jgi:hypothetical protein
MHMLPNLKFLVSGILFCVLLFAVAGAGVKPPDARTRIGEMPAIGRPMMQQSMAEVPVQMHVYAMTAARRSDEPVRLREPVPAETVAARGDVPVAGAVAAGGFVNVPLPPPRPAFFTGLRRHARAFHRRPRVVQQHDATARPPASLGALPNGLTTP